MRSRTSVAMVTAVGMGAALLFASPGAANPAEPAGQVAGAVAGEDDGGAVSFSTDPEAALAELEALHDQMDGGGVAPRGDLSEAPRAATAATAATSPASTAAVDAIESSGSARPKKPKKDEAAEMVVVGRGDRLETQATTDVWAHKDFAYTGSFDSPCGGEPGAGVWVWDTWRKHDPQFVDVIPSPEGSRSNDVKVDRLSSGDILVHSNEACAEGGPGGFEIYNVDDPANPVHLAHVQTDDVNVFLQEELGYVDFGIHNLFLWQQGGRDYVGAKVNSLCGNFQVFDITEPSEPELVSFWGAEQQFLADLGFDGLTCADLGPEEIELLIEVEAWLLSGEGFSDHKLLHDITVTADGTLAYLSNWDAGLVLLDISDPAAPELVSVAMDVENGSLDGELNSHSAWPSEDGTIVVEGEEDFDAWDAVHVPPENLTFGEDPADPAPLPGTALATAPGEAFEGSQTGNEVTVDVESVVVDAGPLAGEEFAAVELGGDQPALADVGPLSGEAVWIGQACDGDEVLNAEAIDPGDIAVVHRGECSFREKNFNAAGAGAAAIVLANNVPSTPWGGIRIWDYSDPTDPTLASTFDTVCSAAPEPIPGCDPDGTYSVHNVIVETVGKRVLAYISWYWDGMLVLDVTDPYNPVEVARFFDDSPEFLEWNGGNPHDFWGVYKEPGRPWIYGSDRNGGMYILKLLGKGFN